MACKVARRSLCEIALRNHPVFGMRLADIRALLPEGFPDELLEEILNEVAQKDHGKRYVLKSISLDFLLENNPKITERECDIFRMRLVGKTLEEAAQKYGVTRERVRQMQARAVRIIKREAAVSNVGITEARFHPLFAEYDFDEDFFCALTEQSLKAYRFLSIISDTKKRKPIEKMFQEVQLPGWIRQNWERYCRENTSFKYLCIVEDDNRLVEKNRQRIIGYLLPKYCLDDILFDDFIALYQDFLAKYGLEDNPKLRITESEKRSQENHLSERPDVLWKRGRSFRYYPIKENDYTELLETLDLNQYHNVELSTLKLFREYPDLMMQYDIRDEYELHNLLKKIECDKEIPGMRWGRNPHIYFGEFDKLAMIQEFMHQLAPICAEDLADAISEAYGFKQDYIMGFFSCIDLYEKDGVYVVDHKAMPDAQLQIFAENLPEDFYYLEEIKSKFAQLFPDGDMEFVNAFNLKRMGFVINSTYAVKNYRNASEYFYTLLTQNDITDITEMSKRFSGITIFSSMLGNLKDNYTIIEFEPYHLIHMRKLEKMGIGAAQMKQYCDEVYAFTRNMTYFTIESLSERGFTSALDALGFEPWFYSSILREDHRFTYQKIGGSVLFDTTCQEVSTQNLILCILNQQNSIEIDQLLTGIQEKFRSVVQPTTLTKKLTLNGETKAYQVYRVRLDLLYYNDQNDRIATWISQYKSEHGENAFRTLTMQQYNDVIEEFIVQSNPTSIEKTKNNIELVNQREPGVVLSDGRIVDGNRRFTCLRQLAEENSDFRWFETVILNIHITDSKKEIKMLELAIQHGEEKKVDYNPIDRLVGVYQDIIKTGLLTVEEYAESTNETIQDVKSTWSMPNC